MALEHFVLRPLILYTKNFRRLAARTVLPVPTPLIFPVIRHSNTDLYGLLRWSHGKFVRLYKCYKSEAYQALLLPSNLSPPDLPNLSAFDVFPLANQSGRVHPPAF